MRKKLNGEEGFSLVELLAVTVILILLGMMVNTGMQMATESYRRIVAQSELDLMKSSVVDALADDLRFAWNVDPSPDPGVLPDDPIVDFIYSSPSFGDKTILDLDGQDSTGNKTGHITAKSDVVSGAEEFLSTAVYGSERGSERAYEVKNLDITFDDDPASPTYRTFTIDLTVGTTEEDLGLTSETSVTIQCLNPNI